MNSTTEITAGATYTVRFEYGRLSPKRFRDAVQVVKDAGGKFDDGTKTWTVIVPELQTKVIACASGAHNPRPEDRPAWSLGPDGQCAKCGGTREIVTEVSSYPLTGLRIVRDSYGAIVERA